MKKPLLLLILLGGLVAFAVYYQKNRDHRVNSARLVGVPQREFLLANLPVADVRQIRIKEGDKTLNLAAVGDRWVAKENSDYPASYDKIQRAVETLAGLRIISKQVVKKDVLPDIKLLAPGEGSAEGSGLQIELLNEKGDVLANVIAGQSVEATGGANSNNYMAGPAEQRFARVPKDENTVWLINNTIGDIQPVAGEWLDKSFVRVDALKSVEITAVDAADSWKAQRVSPDAEFNFADAKNGEELDNAKAEGLATLLNQATFVDVVSKEKATADFMKGAVTAKLTTFDGFTYDVKVLEKKEETGNAEPKLYMTVSTSAEFPKERQPAPDEKPEDKTKNDEAFAAQKKKLEEKLAQEKQINGWVYEVSPYVIGPIFRKRAEILKDQAPEQPAPGTPQTLPFMPSSQPPLRPAPPVSVQPEAAPAAPAPQPQTSPAPAPAPAPPAAE